MDGGNFRVYFGINDNDLKENRVKVKSTEKFQAVKQKTAKNLN